MRSWTTPLAAACALLVCASAASAATPAAAPAGAPTTPAAGQTLRLSDEFTLSRWARVVTGGHIYSNPSSSSRKVGRLHSLTEDHLPEVYLVLASRLDSTGRTWLKIRIPARPNGQTGWVIRAALGGLHVTDQALVVNRRKARMYLYKAGKVRWTAPVGVGAPGTPTPAGHFWIREMFPVNDRKSGYYPYAFGTADYSTLTDWPGGGVVGIHGPFYQPQLIPGHPSHGCMRLHVGDDAWLAHHITVGTPLRVI